MLGAIAIALLAYFLYPLNTQDGSLLRPHQGSLSHIGDSDSDASKFALADLPGRGKGLIAVRDIEVSALLTAMAAADYKAQRGELLIREKPLFRVPFSSKLFWPI